MKKIKHKKFTMSLKIQVHNNGTDLTIKPVFRSQDLGKLNREMNFKTSMWTYKLVDLEQITKILKDSGLEDKQIEWVQTPKNSLQDTVAYRHKSRYVGWEYKDNRIVLSYTFNLQINELVKTFRSRKFDMKIKKWSVDTVDWIPLSEKLEDLGYILQSLWIHPQLGITEEFEDNRDYSEMKTKKQNNTDSDDDRNYSITKKQKKKGKCPQLLDVTPNIIKHDTPMSTQAWKDEVLREFNKTNNTTYE